MEERSGVIVRCVLNAAILLLVLHFTLSQVCVRGGERGRAYSGQN